MGMATWSEIERQYLIDLWIYCGGCKQKMANVSRLGRATIYRKIAQHNINAETFRVMKAIEGF